MLEKGNKVCALAKPKTPLSHDFLLDILSSCRSNIQMSSKLKPKNSNFDVMGFIICCINFAHENMSQFAAMSARMCHKGFVGLQFFC